MNAPQAAQGTQRPAWVDPVPSSAPAQPDELTGLLRRLVDAAERQAAAAETSAELLAMIAHGVDRTGVLSNALGRGAQQDAFEEVAELMSSAENAARNTRSFNEDEGA